MKNVPDAVVVGAGPAGSCAAWELAKRGVEVAVFEEHPQVGIPSHCAGHLSMRSLKNLGLYPPAKGILENVFSGANFYSPSGTKFAVELSSPVTCAVNRSLFDEYLAKKAKEAGARYFLDSKVNSLLKENCSVRGVKVTKEAKTENVPAKVVVDAEGISSRLLRQAGLMALNGGRLVYAVEAEVENVRDVEEHAVEVYLGTHYAPGFYGWLIPRLDGTAKVGLAVRKGNPKQFLRHLMLRHPVASAQLRTAKVKHMAFHAIPLGGPIPVAFADGFLAVGDVASQVKPTTGGGVIFSLTCAKAAAEVVKEALERNDFSADFLGLYQKRYSELLGLDVRVMLRMREFLDALSDKKLDNAVRFAAKVGLDKALRDVKEIDFQGRMLLSLLKKPAAYAALAYFAGLYLSANA